MNVIFTDLDATLLDANTYSWEAARPALELLERRGIPWVMVSSKTGAEMARLREDMGHRHPYVVENGGAAYIPEGYFAAPVGGVIEWGTAYAELVAALGTASAESHCRVRGFHAMTDAEVSRATGLPLDAAARARQREYDEAFEVLDRAHAPALLAAIERAGYRWTHGGRFHHICGNNDKATAVKALTALFAQRYGAPVRTIGLGDSLNDLSMLHAVDTPVLIRSHRPPPPEILALRGVHYSRATGPEGWNESVLAILTDGSR